MAPMVERVAKALFENMLATETDGSCAPWESAHPVMRERMMGRARAAVEAMQTNCFECGSPVTLVCLACQKPDS